MGLHRGAVVSPTRLAVVAIGLGTVITIVAIVTSRRYGLEMRGQGIVLKLAPASPAPTGAASTSLPSGRAPELPTVSPPSTR